MKLNEMSLGVYSREWVMDIERSGLCLEGRRMQAGEQE